MRKVIIIWSIAGLLFFMMAILAAFEPNNEKLENKHENKIIIEIKGLNELVEALQNIANSIKYHD